MQTDGCLLLLGVWCIRGFVFVLLLILYSLIYNIHEINHCSLSSLFHTFFHMTNNCTETLGFPPFIVVEFDNTVRYNSTERECNLLENVSAARTITGMRIDSCRFRVCWITLEHLVCMKWKKSSHAYIIIFIPDF